MTEQSFQTAAGCPVPTVTADEMREVDRVATEDVGLQLLQMMENAGRNLALAVREHVDDTDDVVVLAGNGGNGGGGLACTRHLANHGVSVSVVLDRPGGELTGAAATHFGILDAMAVPVSVESEDQITGDILVDALIGYGLGGPLRGTAATLVEAIPDGSTVVSLDVPTGRNATTGDQPGPAVDPDVVVTLALPKTGLVGLDCPVTLADIGIPRVVYDRAEIPDDGPFGGEYLVALHEI